MHARNYRRDSLKGPSRLQAGQLVVKIVLHPLSIYCQRAISEALTLSANRNLY
jgi:hypothetical protein